MATEKHRHEKSKAKDKKGRGPEKAASSHVKTTGRWFMYSRGRACQRLET